jgi:hypothetical protein
MGGEVFCAFNLSAEEVALDLPGLGGEAAFEWPGQSGALAGGVLKLPGYGFFISLFSSFPLT